MSWSVAVHGGAKPIGPDREAANRHGCDAAVAAARRVLERDGTAIEAVEAAIGVLESDPAFNAGFGSVLNEAGAVEMDAAIMDGATLDIGAVAAVEGVRHPVSVAGLMLREPPTLLVGPGARRFAAEHGAETCEPRDMISQEQSASKAQSGHDTVGCVALDSAGNFAAGTSTGGLSGTVPGRVGDSPLPGCGFYADNAAGAVALSGDGENIARLMLGARVIQGLEAGEDPARTVERALAGLARIGGEAGGIALDRHGRLGWAHNSSHFAVGWASSELERAFVWLRKIEDR